ncbi:hypothetical protein [Arthrobacter sp. L77]|nr:hypothetical protein [Arthrobacter sp. L77]
MATHQLDTTDAEIVFDHRHKNVIADIRRPEDRPIDDRTLSRLTIHSKPS